MIQRQEITNIRESFEDFERCEASANRKMHDSVRGAMKMLRITLSETAAKFGSRMGVCPSYVYMLESGKRDWSTELLKEVEESL